MEKFKPGDIVEAKDENGIYLLEILENNGSAEETEYQILHGPNGPMNIRLSMYTDSLLSLIVQRHRHINVEL